MVICYLGVGSNLGDRRKNIRLALGKINALKNTKVIKLSRIIETMPVGGPSGQSKFLNAALKAETSIPAVIFLKKLKIIEKELGREKSVRYGPRTIDLDILFYGNKIIKTKNFKVPHSKIFQRDFVMKPLMEIL